MEYRCLAFDELNTTELYTIMRLRQEVFVVEQDCAYLDADGKDLESQHVLGVDEQGQLLAYVRICPPGLSYEAYSSIGRVIVAESIRGTGEGYRLMEYALAQTRQHYPDVPNKISAQAHLEGYYGKLGYKATGESYLEDGIPHIGMIQ